jgi:hypothetical protein
MQVNITKRIDTFEGKRYCPVVFGPNVRQLVQLIDARALTSPAAGSRGSR